MSRIICFVLFAITSATTVLAQEELPRQLETDKQKASYGLGMQIGQNFARGGFDAKAFDYQALISGFRDALTKQTPKVSQQDFQAAMQVIQREASARYSAKMKPLADSNAKKGANFLAKFKGLRGVKATASGLMYQIIKAGDAKAPRPKPTDVVRVHYQGKLISGKVFDSSLDGDPATFPVNRVIAGWTEALQLMTVGSKWRLAIPSDLAYGPQGSPPNIGPNAVLLFDVELLGIEGQN